MVLGTPNNKCPHGIFKGRESVARYCSFCTPESALTSHHREVSVSLNVEADMVDFDREDILDAAAFMDQNPARRLAAG